MFYDALSPQFILVISFAFELLLIIAGLVTLTLRFDSMFNGYVNRWQLKWLRIMLKDTVNLLWNINTSKDRTPKVNVKVLFKFSPSRFYEMVFRKGEHFHFFPLSFIVLLVEEGFLKATWVAPGSNYSTDYLHLLTFSVPTSLLLPARKVKHLMNCSLKTEE